MKETFTRIKLKSKSRKIKTS